MFRTGLQRLASPTAVSVRTLATAAEHKPVVTIYGLHARYANATYVVASKAGKLDQVEAELTALAKAAEKPGAWASLLSNPLISRNAKVAAVSKMNDKLTPVTLNLLVTMAANARLGDLPKVAETFEQLMKAKRGEVEAKIISAEPLSPAQLKAVQTAMASQFPKGKKVVITPVTDPSIVGGLQVQIGDQFLDLSVKSRIDEISMMNVD